MSTLAIKSMAGKKGTTGGPREGSGRKPVEDPQEKKVPITFYIKAKNKQILKAKVDPIIAKLDKN